MTIRKWGVLAVALVMASAAWADDAAVHDDPFTMTLAAGYGQFTKQVQTAKSPEGDIETTNWVAKAPTGEAVIVTQSRMPGKILDPQKMIASTQASLLKTLGATLESEEATAADTSRSLFKSNGAFFRARFAVIEDRLYQLLYVGRSEEQRTAATVAQMFDSFRITAE